MRITDVRVTHRPPHWSEARALHERSKVTPDPLPTYRLRVQHERHVDVVAGCQLCPPPGYHVMTPSGRVDRLTEWSEE